MFLNIFQKNYYKKKWKNLSLILLVIGFITLILPISSNAATDIYYRNSYDYSYYKYMNNQNDQDYVNMLISSIFYSNCSDINPINPNWSMSDCRKWSHYITDSNTDPPRLTPYGTSFSAANVRFYLRKYSKVPSSATYVYKSGDTMVWNGNSTSSYNYKGAIAFAPSYDFYEVNHKLLIEFPIDQNVLSNLSTHHLLHYQIAFTNTKQFVGDSYRTNLTTYTNRVLRNSNLNLTTNADIDNAYSTYLFCSLSRNKDLFKQCDPSWASNLQYVGYTLAGLYDSYTNTYSDHELADFGSGKFIAQFLLDNQNFYRFNDSQNANNDWLADYAMSTNRFVAYSKIKGKVMSTYTRTTAQYLPWVDSNSVKKNQSMSLLTDIIIDLGMFDTSSLSTNDKISVFIYFPDAQQFQMVVNLIGVYNKNFIEPKNALENDLAPEDSDFYVLIDSIINQLPSSGIKGIISQPVKFILSLIRFVWRFILLVLSFIENLWWPIQFLFYCCLYALIISIVAKIFISLLEVLS